MIHQRRWLISMILNLTVVSRGEVGPLDVYQWRIQIRSSGLAERYNGASCALPLDQTSNIYDQYPTYSCRKYIGPNFSSVLWGWVNSVMRERIFCGVLTVGSSFKLDFNLLAPEIYIYILAHPVCKMWIILESKKVALWNKRHFVKEKRRVCSIFKILSTYSCWKKYI
jgi:hypothetical protein